MSSGITSTILSSRLLFIWHQLLLFNARGINSSIFGFIRAYFETKLLLKIKLTLIANIAKIVPLFFTLVFVSNPECANVTMLCSLYNALWGLPHSSLASLLRCIQSQWALTAQGQRSYSQESLEVQSHRERLPSRCLPAGEPHSEKLQLATLPNSKADCEVSAIIKRIINTWSLYQWSGETDALPLLLACRGYPRGHPRLVSPWATHPHSRGRLLFWEPQNGPLS